MNNENVFDIRDYEKRRVVFTKKKLLEKKNDHPELGNKQFLECVKKTISEPDQIWPDYQDTRKHCYYSKYTEYTFAKVVIWAEGDPKKVITAYEIDYIKEAKYKNLKRIL